MQLKYIRTYVCILMYLATHVSKYISFLLHMDHAMVKIRFICMKRKLLMAYHSYMIHVSVIHFATTYMHPVHM